MTTREAADRLEWPWSTVRTWARRLNLGGTRGTGNTLSLSEEDLDVLRRERRRAQEIKSKQNAEAMRGRNLSVFKTPEQHAYAVQRMTEGRQRTLQKLDRNWRDAQWRDYYGEHHFEICVTASADPELSSRIPGGPVYATLQWHRTAFYDTDLD